LVLARAAHQCGGLLRRRENGYASARPARSRDADVIGARGERHGFKYKRNGTLSFSAALKVKTGSLDGMTAARHTRAEFLRFLDCAITIQSARKEIHLIANNLSTHKTKAVAV